MTISSLAAAVQVQFDPQSYTVTEGDVVSITLVTNTSNYMFGMDDFSGSGMDDFTGSGRDDFTVTLQNMGGTATGESFNGSFTRTLKILLIQFITKHIL